MTGSNQSNVLKYLGLDYIFNGENVSGSRAPNGQKTLQNILGQNFKGYIFTTNGSYKFENWNSRTNITSISLKTLYNMGNSSDYKFYYSNTGINENPTRLIELTHFCKLRDQPPEWNRSGLNKKLEDLYKKFVGESVDGETNENGNENGNGNGNENGNGVAQQGAQPAGNTAVAGGAAATAGGAAATAGGAAAQTAQEDSLVNGEIRTIRSNNNSIEEE